MSNINFSGNLQTFATDVFLSNFHMFQKDYFKENLRTAATVYLFNHETIKLGLI